MNCFFVSPQISGFSKGFAAILTAEIAQLLVNSVFMSPQISRLFERFSAQWTKEELIAVIAIYRLRCVTSGLDGVLLKLRFYFCGGNDLYCQ